MHAYMIRTHTQAFLLLWRRPRGAWRLLRAARLRARLQARGSQPDSEPQAGKVRAPEYRIVLPWYHDESATCVL